MLLNTVLIFNWPLQQEKIYHLLKPLLSYGQVTFLTF